MLHMNPIIFRSKFSLLLNILYDIWTKRLENMIDTVQTVLGKTLKFVCHVYTIVFFSIIWPCFIWFTDMHYKLDSNLILKIKF